MRCVGAQCTYVCMLAVCVVCVCVCVCVCTHHGPSFSNQGAVTDDGMKVNEVMKSKLFVQMVVVQLHLLYINSLIGLLHEQD